MPYPLYCISHRGGSQNHTENTLGAIAESLVLGVDAIEIDVWKVGEELLVTHDRRLGISLPGQGRLLDQNPGLLREMVLGCGNRIATLAEVLDLVRDRACLNIEIKGPDCSDAIATLLRQFTTEYQLSLDQYLLSSFDHHQLYHCSQILPEVRRGALIHGLPLDYAACADALRAWSFHPDLTFVNRALVEDAHRRGLKVMVYTVNHEEDWHLMCDLGVEGVFTDFPGQLLEWNHNQRESNSAY